MELDDRPEDPIDDEPAIAGMDEREAWVQVVMTAVTTVAYLVVVAPRVRADGAASVEWVVPMLVAVVVNIVGTIVGSILMGVGGAFSLYRRGQDPNVELGSDLRDREITRFASRRSSIFLYAGLLIALVLSMLDADTFWIGSAVFVAGALGSIVEAIIRLAAYRRGFVE